MWKKKKMQITFDLLLYFLNCISISNTSAHNECLFCSSQVNKKFRRNKNNENVTPTHPQLPQITGRDWKGHIQYEVPHITGRIQDERLDMTTEIHQTHTNVLRALCECTTTPDTEVLYSPL